MALSIGGNGWMMAVLVKTLSWLKLWLKKGLKYAYDVHQLSLLYKTNALRPSVFI